MAKKLKAGMSATLKSEFTGFRGKDRLASYGYSKGETVTLISYDSHDESWRVCKPGQEAKQLEHIFVKRSQLIPGAAAQPEQGEHGWKVGDTLPEALLNDGTARHYYGHSHDDGWTVKGERFFIDDRTIEDVRIIEGRTGLLISGTKNIWVAVGDLPQKSKVTTPEAPKPEPAGEDNIVEMECVDNSGFTKWLTIGKTYKVHTNKRIAGTFKITGLDQTRKGGPDNDSSLYLFIQKRFKPTEAPKPAEPGAPKKRMAECVNMTDSSADFTVGKQYEIVGGYDEFLTLIDDNGHTQSGMFRWRFKELTEDKLSQFLTELQALIEKFK